MHKGRVSNPMMSLDRIVDDLLLKRESQGECRVTSDAAQVQVNCSSQDALTLQAGLQISLYSTCDKKTWRLWFTMRYAHCPSMEGKDTM